MEHLTIFISVVLGISLAMERGIEILRTWFPRLRRPEEVPEKLRDYREQVGGTNPAYRKEKARRFFIQLLAIAGSWLIAAVLTDADWPQALWSAIEIGEAENTFAYPVPLVGLLASAGSAFWREILGYTRQIRRLQQQVSVSAQNQRAARARLKSELSKIQLPQELSSPSPNTLIA